MTDFNLANDALPMTRSPAQIRRLIAHLQTLSRVPGQKPKNISEWAAEAADALAHLAAEPKPVAWMHTRHMELDQTTVRLTGDEDERPFGEPGRDYSAEYRVTVTPLYAHPAPPAPAAMPGVEDCRAASNSDQTCYAIPGVETVARLICMGNPDDCVFGTGGTNEPSVCHTRRWQQHVGQATAVLTLFQPLTQENERLNRNRDMWKEQCERQAETLRELRMQMLSDEGQQRDALAAGRIAGLKEAATLAAELDPNAVDVSAAILARAGDVEKERSE